MSKSWVAVGIGGILALALPLWAYYSDSSAPRESLSVARVALPAVALTHIAESQGYFADEGVDVTFADFTTGREALDAACAGRYELAIAFTTPVVHDIVIGRDLVCLTALHQSPHNTALVTLASRGINEPADLAGKTVGVTKGTSGELFLDVLLADNGLDSTSVVRKEVNILDADKALKEGSVDAVVAWNPYLHGIKTHWPAHELRVFTSTVYLEMSMLAGLRETVDGKGEAIRRFLRALARAQEFFGGNRTAACVAANRQARGPARIEADSPMWDDFTVGLGLNHVILLTLNQEAEWMRSYGLTRGPLPDFRQHMMDEYLREILPDLVTIPLGDDPRLRVSEAVHSEAGAP